MAEPCKLFRVFLDPYAHNECPDIVRPPVHQNRAKFDDMGGGGHYPYNKHVWSPAGGWWSRPANWKSNTAIAAGGIVGVVAFVWSVSADVETRDRQPTRWIPSMLWSRALKENPKFAEHS